MSKIAGNKALKAYPQVWNEEEDFDVNEEGRWAFQEGYDQGVKDALHEAGLWWYNYLRSGYTEDTALIMVKWFHEEIDKKYE